MSNKQGAGNMKYRVLGLTILPVLLLLLLAPTIAYTGTQPTGSQINCFKDSDCSYGYYCPSTGQLAQCQSISNQELLICSSNSDCSTRQICAQDFLKQHKACASCEEHWALKQTANGYCAQDAAQCGTTLNKPRDYAACSTSAQQQQCQESWSCGQWICFNNKISRGCTDINGCGTTVNKPATEFSGECGKEGAKADNPESLLHVGIQPPSQTGTRTIYSLYGIQLYPEQLAVIIGLIILGIWLLSRRR